MKRKSPRLKREIRKFLPFLFSVAFLPEQANGQTTLAINGNHQHIMQNNNESLQVQSNGQISFSPDGKSITAISDGGYFTIQKTSSGYTKRLSIRNTESGLSYEYSENGQEIAFEPAGEAWLAEILPGLIRSSGMGTASKVDGVFKEGGTTAVLEEISKIDNEHVRFNYLSLLLQKEIKPADIPLVINSIGRSLQSGHYLLEIFNNHKELLLSTSENVALFLAIPAQVEQDHYQAQLVSLALEHPLAPTHQKQVLELIASIQNDHFKAKILMALLQQELADAEIQWLTNNILPAFRSNHSRNELIKRILETQANLSSNALEGLIGSMNSGRTSFLNEALLEEIILHPNISSQNVEALLGMLRQLHSEHDKVGMMKLLVKSGKLEPHLNEFLSESVQIRSDHSRGEILIALTEQLALDENQLIELINSGATIRSDSFKADFLKHACTLTKSEREKEAIRQAAKSIRSSHLYEEVLKCIE